MAFIGAIVAIVIAIVGEIIRPKQKPPNVKAASVDELDIPTAEEGRTIYAIAGKVRLDATNCTWYGDLETFKVTKKVKTGWFSSTRQTIAVRYSMGMSHHVCFSGPDFEIHEINFGGKMPKHTRTDEADGVVRFDFNDMNFYGGEKEQNALGGVSGTLRFYRGTATQPSNAYMSAQLGEEYPAYRDFCHFVIEHMYLGNSEYIKPVAVVVSTYPNELGVTGGMHKIGPVDDEDANPICMIYQLMTNPVWAAGTPAGEIDVTNFREKAEQCFNEGYGMSMVYSGNTAKEYIKEILRHIDGVLYTDPETGLQTIALARNDYVLDDLPILTKDDFVGGVKFRRPSWDETKNTLKSSYTDRENDYTEAVIQMQDLANITVRGGEIAPEQIDYQGFTKYEPCALSTARALKMIAYPSALLDGAILRKQGWKAKPAKVYKIEWPELGLNGNVYRMTDIAYGDLNTVAVGVKLIEDVYSIGAIPYIQPPPSGWENPVGVPSVLAAQQLVEAPFYGAPGNARYILTLAAEGPGNHVAYDVMTDMAGGSAYVNTNSVEEFTPTGVLTAPLALSRVDDLAAGITVGGLNNAAQIDSGSATDAQRVDGRNLMVIGNEWLAWNTMVDNGDTTYTFTGVLSGVLDTIPDAHLAGDRVWFPSEGAGLVNEEGWTANVSPRVKLLPRTVNETLDDTLATSMVLTTTSRALRPIVPGKFRINATRPALISGTITGLFTVTWAHRNRNYPEILSQSADSVEPEAGTLYTMRVYDDTTNTLIVSDLDMNGVLATVTIASAATLRLELGSIRDGLESHQRQIAIFNYTPGGVLPDAIHPDEPEYILDGGGA